MGPSDGAKFTGKLEEQNAERERLTKEREAFRGAYREIANTPAFKDILRFIDSQIEGCKDRAVITDNAHVSEKHLHMLLMASIIREYIDNQSKI